MRDGLYQGTVYQGLSMSVTVNIRERSISGPIYIRDDL